MSESTVATHPQPAPPASGQTTDDVIFRRAMLIIAISLAVGLGITFVPEVLDRFSPFFKNLFQSGIATGGLFAIVLNIVLPRSP